MDFYVILGIGREASPGEVKRAYKRLARRYHPDINPGDREAAAVFRRATEAYETLSDPGRRQEYDAHGTEVPVVEEASVEFRGFDFSGPVSGASATFDELFSSVVRDAADAATVGDRYLAVVPVERPEVELLRSLDEVRPHQHAFREMFRAEMFHHRDMGEIPRDRQEFAGDFLILIRESIGFLRRFRARIPMHFHSRFQPQETVSTHSVSERRVMHGTPWKYASYCRPPESVTRTTTV